jgi:hypothetical protein
LREGDERISVPLRGFRRKITQSFGERVGVSRTVFASGVRVSVVRGRAKNMLLLML